VNLGELSAMFEAVPYAKFLGVQFELKGDELTAILPFKNDLIGNPMLPALHGGVVGALMELTAVAQIFLAQGGKRIPKVIDISIDYEEGMNLDNHIYKEAHIEKAINIPLSQLPAKIHQLPDLGEKKIVLQCKSGIRSMIGCQTLNKEGFQYSLWNLEGGIHAWSSSGFPIMTLK
jgi:rhodanese-related sulfurtransferase